MRRKDKYDVEVQVAVAVEVEVEVVEEEEAAVAVADGQAPHTESAASPWRALTTCRSAT